MQVINALFPMLTLPLWVSMLLLLHVITIQSFSNSNIWVTLGSIFQHRLLEATANVRSDITLYDLNKHTGRCDLEKFLNGNIASQAMVPQITSEPLIPVSNKQRDWAGYPNWLFHQHTYTNSLAVRSNALSITCRHSKCDMASPSLASISHAGLLRAQT